MSKAKNKFLAPSSKIVLGWVLMSFFCLPFAEAESTFKLKRKAPPRSAKIKQAPKAEETKPVVKKQAPKKKQSVAKKKPLRKKNVRKKKRSATRMARKTANPNASGKIESMRNKVEIKSKKSSSWRKATRRSTLKGDDQIRTGSRSIARVKLNDGSKVLLLQNSEAEMENLSTVEKTIKLLRGRIRAIVRRLKASNTFKIKTPIGVASVRGTDFEVEFLEESKEMQVDVKSGQVGVAKLGDLANEIIVNPGEKVRFSLEGELTDPIQTGSIPLQRQDVRTEVVIASVKNSIVTQAAEEIRTADYQTGKSLIDVDGRRVRVEEYITRPASNQFKLVSLNHRDTRFDYFTYTGTFNQDLPSDLSVALGQIGGRLTTAPDYYLTDYEMFMSNTKDSIQDVGSGGHLVKIEFDGTNYTLTDNGDPTNTKTVAAAALQTDGSYKIYNPIADKFSLVSAANLSSAQQFSIRDGDTIRNYASGDVYFRTRYNTNTFSINGTQKSAFAPKSGVTNTLALDLDATFTNPAITTVTEFPSGTGTLHNRLSLFYSDGSKLVYDNYIIDDEGNVAGSSQFSGISTSSEYQTQLLNFNYQQKVKADEMSDSINLVIDPRIGTMSGLIQ